jgi:hypothetical protein
MIAASCLVASIAFGAAAPKAQPATRPATINPRAYNPEDASITPQLAKILTAKPVSLDLKDTPALTAIEQLAKASGYSIKPGSDTWFRQGQKPKNVTLSMSNQPFWVVMREICARANINLWNNGGGNETGIQIAPGNYGYNGMMRSAASIQGPFLSVITDLRRINTVNMSDPKKVDRKIQIQMQTFAEPGVKMAQMSYQPSVVEAADDNGNAMVPEAQPDRRNMQGSNGNSWYGTMSIPYPTTNPGTRIAKLKGTIDGSLHMQSEPVEFVDPLKATNASKTLGAQKVELSFLKKDGDNYSAEIIIYRGEQDQQAFNRSLNQQPSLHLTDAQNREYQTQFRGATSDGTKNTLQYQFRPTSRDAASKPSEPTKLAMEITTAMQDIEVPFELNDLPLP